MPPRDLEARGYEGRAVRCLLHADESAERGALLIPGQFYTPQAPLLHFARAVLVANRYAVLDVWWNPSEAGGAGAEWLEATARGALGVLPAEYPLQLLVGKSLGTRALAALYRDPERADVPGIWLTPLIRGGDVRDALAGTRAPALLIGGTADGFFDVDAAESVRSDSVELLVIEGANHDLAVASPVESARVLERVTEAMERFVERI